MNEKETGVSVYPIITNDDPCRTVYSEGMSLRDYFAGQVLNGLMGNQGMTESIGRNSRNAIDAMNTFVNTSYSYADAMLKERKNGIQLYNR